MQVRCDILLILPCCSYSDALFQMHLKEIDEEELEGLMGNGGLDSKTLSRKKRIFEEVYNY